MLFMLVSAPCTHLQINKFVQQHHVSTHHPPGLVCGHPHRGTARPSPAVSTPSLLSGGAGVPGPSSGLQCWVPTNRVAGTGSGLALLPKQTTRTTQQKNKILLYSPLCHWWENLNMNLSTSGGEGWVTRSFWFFF